MDNFVTGSPDNVAPFQARPGFRLVRHNVTEYIRMDGALDWVLHLASPASPRDYLELPIQTLKVGALGTHNALGLAMATGARFLLASTSEVYGDALVHPQREDSRIARIFNSFGPSMRIDDGRAIPAFISQALAGQPLTIFGDGSQTRSFQYISDLIDGLWRLMRAPVNDPVNLGNPQEMTLLELAKRIFRLTGARSEIVFRPLPTDDPKVRQPEIGRARALLGWEPRVDVDEGLRLTIDWFRRRLRG